MSFMIFLLATQHFPNVLHYSRETTYFGVKKNKTFMTSSWNSQFDFMFYTFILHYLTAIILIQKTYSPLLFSYYKFESVMMAYIPLSLSLVHSNRLLWNHGQCWLRDNNTVQTIIHSGRHKTKLCVHCKSNKFSQMCHNDKS